MILESVIDHELLTPNSVNINAPESNAVLEHNLNRGDLYAAGDDAPIEPDVERIHSFSNGDNNGNNESLRDDSHSSLIAQQIDDVWKNDCQKSIDVGSSDTGSVEIIHVRNKLVSISGSMKLNKKRY